MPSNKRHEVLNDGRFRINHHLLSISSPHNRADCFCDTKLGFCEVLDFSIDDDGKLLIRAQRFRLVDVPLFTENNEASNLVKGNFPYFYSFVALTDDIVYLKPDDILSKCVLLRVCLHNSTYDLMCKTSDVYVYS